MNKELTKKFKNEFNHWLNGGSVLCLGGGEPQWFEDKDPNKHWNLCFSPDFIQKVVINDEYVEFRKALAEGKIIQYRTIAQKWYDITDNFEIMKQPEMRIKPEPQQFKVGDWVTHPDVEIPFQFTKYDTCPKIKLWEPQPNEWCWFWTNDLIVPTLDQLRNIDAHVHPYITKRVGRCANCEPFIGILPINLQHKITS